MVSRTAAAGGRLGRVFPGSWLLIREGNEQESFIQIRASEQSRVHSKAREQQTMCVDAKASSIAGPLQGAIEAKI